MKPAHPYSLICLFVFVPVFGLAQCDGTFKVLHYTETTGFDHNTRNQSLSMFQSWESDDDFLVTSDNNGDEFNSLANLQQYAVVVFSNTSGDNGLNATQRSNFEAYIAGGGSYLGIHAASDTYRHSSANGGSKGTWDWYAENVAGATVQQNPNHTSQNHNNTMTHQQVGHPTLTNVPSPWNKTEEYYYWENGYLNTTFTELLRVGVTGSNSRDSARMMAHCKNLPGGGRAFYTALGHAKSNYTNDQNFQELIRNALNWVAEPNKGSGGSGTVTASISITNGILCFGDSASIQVFANNGIGPYTYSWNNGSNNQSQTGLPSGTYSVEVTDSDGCKVTTSITLNEPDELTLAPSSTPSNDPTAPNGTATVTPSGGTPPFSFLWKGPGNYTAGVKTIQGLSPGEYTVTVTDNNGCEATGMTTVDNTTSIQEALELLSFTVFPVPAEDRLTIQGQSQGQIEGRLSLINLQGAALLHRQFSANGAFKVTMNLSSLSAGIYLLSVETDKGRAFQRVVIQ